MIVSPTNVSVPLIAPSVNVQTEQAARDNRVREPVTPTVALAKTNAERKVKSDEKRRRQSSWDPLSIPITKWIMKLMRVITRSRKTRLKGFSIYWH